MSAERYARGRVIPPPIVPTNQEIISFSEILGGALGSREAEAAHFENEGWSETGTPSRTGGESMASAASPSARDTSRDGAVHVHHTTLTMIG